jgi:hypothetical protein
MPMAFLPTWSKEGSVTSDDASRILAVDRWLIGRLKVVSWQVLFFQFQLHFIHSIESSLEE